VIIWAEWFEQSLPGATADQVKVKPGTNVRRIDAMKFARTPGAHSGLHRLAGRHDGPYERCTLEQLQPDLFLARRSLSTTANATRTSMPAKERIPARERAAASRATTVAKARTLAKAKAAARPTVPRSSSTDSGRAQNGLDPLTRRPCLQIYLTDSKTTG